MQGAPCRPARSSARSFFVLPLVLALLALASFPVFARAESPGAVYNPKVEQLPPTASKVEPTKVTKGSTKPEENAKAEGSNAQSTEKPAQKPQKEPEEEEGSSQKKKSGAAAGKSENNGPKSGGKEGKSEIGGTKKVAGSESAGGNANKVNTATGENASSSGGGSSPLVPILIVVVILAAISIGVVLYRQRRDAGDSDGRDGRVSSPNAS